MIVYSYFIINGVCKDNCSIKNVEMINARNKLKVYKGEPIKCDIKETYKHNKYFQVSQNQEIQQHRKPFHL